MGRKKYIKDPVEVVKEAYGKDALKNTHQVNQLNIQISKKGKYVVFELFNEETREVEVSMLCPKQQALTIAQIISDKAQTIVEQETTKAS
jgi:hypothetical protein